MPKPSLKEEDALLESQIIETLLAGLHEWRRDLSYPLSHSDMQACVRGLMKMFEVKRRPLVSLLRIKCGDCAGLGHWRTAIDQQTTCSQCHGKGWIGGE